MFAKRLSLGLVGLFLWASPLDANADVTGSFDISINLYPEGTQTESVKQKIDIEPNLQVNYTFSGLTLGADVGFGVTGPEFGISSLTTDLGALRIYDQFVFATPFYTSGTDVSPTYDGTGTPNGMGFVKKRVDMELNIAGITLNNLAVFEDVDFPAPSSTNPTYHLFQVNNIPGDQTPTYAFGDRITLSGATISGITLIGTTGICFTDDINHIKKRTFLGRVNPACAGFPAPPEKSNLYFDYETLRIENVVLAEVQLNMALTFTPLEPLVWETVARFTLLEQIDVVVRLVSHVITELDIESVSLSLTSGPFSLALTDNDGDLHFDNGSLLANLTLNANQNPASLTSLTLFEPDKGITSQSVTLSLTRGPLTFSTSSSLLPNNLAQLNWQSTTFTLSGKLGITTLSINMSVAPSGLQKVTIKVGVVF